MDAAGEVIHVLHPYTLQVVNRKIRGFCIKNDIFNTCISLNYFVVSLLCTIFVSRNKKRKYNNGKKEKLSVG